MTSNLAGKHRALPAFEGESCFQPHATEEVDSLEDHFFSSCPCPGLSDLSVILEPGPLLLSLEGE